MKTFGNSKNGTKSATCDFLLATGVSEFVAIRQLADVHGMTVDQAKAKFRGHIAYLRKNQLADVRVKVIGGEKRFKAHVLPHLAGVSSVENVSIATHPAVSATPSGQSETSERSSNFGRSASAVNMTIDRLLSGGCRFSDVVNTLVADHGLSRVKAAGKAKARIRELGAVEHRGFYRVGL